jgi:uncharacterized membrane protein
LVGRISFLLGHRVRRSLWLIPFACALVGIGLSFATVAIDRAFPDELVARSLTGDPNAALMILATIAASMVSLTALVLTITSVVVQLAMGQFSPRSVRPFLQDRPSQLAIGMFVGTFAHAMLAMREVRSFTGQGSVPGVTIVVSFTLVIIDIVVLVAYVHHIANSLKVDSIIESVGSETRRTLDRLYPESERASPQASSSRAAIRADRAGTVFHVDHAALVELASKADVVLEMPARIGTFVPEGAPLFLYEQGAGQLDEDAVLRAVAIGPERTMDQDGAFGIQTLVDIAERALSESFNDQTTAAQVIDRLHDLLRRLATCRLASGRFVDTDGVLRLSVPELTWDDYVRLAFDDLRLAADGSPSVLHRLREALEDLLDIAPAERREPLEARLRGLPEAATDSRRYLESERAEAFAAQPGLRRGR